MKVIHFSAIPILGLSVLCALAVTALYSDTSVKAQTVPAGSVCRVSMIFDRSGSVGEQGVQTMRNQVKRLFEPNGLYDSSIELAFWTFSHSDTASGYNGPYHDFVSSRGGSTSFDINLNKIYSGGLTNYQQAFGYFGQTRNKDIAQIIDATNIMVFMTDGQPNRPDGSASPDVLGRQAALAHQKAGRIIVGGAVGAANLPVIRYVLTGDYNNKSADTFTISANYNDLAAKLKNVIGEKCRRVTVCPTNTAIPANSPDCRDNDPYSLIPRAGATPTIAERGEKVTYDYSIRMAPRVPNISAQWYAVGLKVNPSVSVESITNFDGGYVESSSTLDGVKTDMIRRLGGTANASIITGTPSGAWRQLSLANEEIAVPSTARVGEKYCRVLVVAKPTHLDTPTFRASSAACTTVGEKPKIQISGGDVRVGRRFIDSRLSALTSKIETSTTTVDSRLYGSWTEYGVSAPGSISGLASSSGLRGGGLPARADEQRKLTFANTPQLGSFEDTDVILNDTIGAIIRQYDLRASPQLGGTVEFDTNTNGLYAVDSNISLQPYQLAKGQTIIIYAPNNTVTINGNITYTTQPISSPSQIPQLIIIADRINIASNVTQIDAWLIANGQNGRIDTCANEPALSTQVCNSRLTINGPVMAQQLLLRRTAGIGAVGSTRDMAAETFNLRADAYIWAYARSTDNRRIVTTDTIELSPRF